MYGDILYTNRKCCDVGDCNAQYAHLPLGKGMGINMNVDYKLTYR